MIQQVVGCRDWVTLSPDVINESPSNKLWMGQMEK